MCDLGVVISHVKFVRIVNFVDKISEQKKANLYPLRFESKFKVSQRFTL